MPEAPPDLSTGQLLEILHDLPVGVVLEDAAGAVRWASQRAGELVGRPPGELLGEPLSSLPLEASAHQTDEGELVHLPGAAEGAPQWLQLLPGPELGALRVTYLVDATELEQARTKVDRLTQALRGQSATDTTTGLLNRRAVLSQLEAQVSRSRRYHNLLSVLLLELECVVGDPPQVVELTEPMVLAVSRMLRDQTRWPDIIGRWDAMRFLLVLPETSAESAGMLRDKVADQLGRLPALGGESGPRCTARSGIAEWAQGDMALALVERAEAALQGG
jgi:GGDEF domain-containing protein